VRSLSGVQGLFWCVGRTKTALGAFRSPRNPADQPRPLLRTPMWRWLRRTQPTPHRGAWAGDMWAVRGSGADAGFLAALRLEPDVHNLAVMWMTMPCRRLSRLWCRSPPIRSIRWWFPLGGRVLPGRAAGRPRPRHASPLSLSAASPAHHSDLPKGPRAQGPKGPRPKSPKGPPINPSTYRTYQPRHRLRSPPTAVRPAHRARLFRRPIAGRCSSVGPRRPRARRRPGRRGGRDNRWLCVLPRGHRPEDASAERHQGLLTHLVRLSVEMGGNCWP